MGYYISTKIVGEIWLIIYENISPWIMVHSYIILKYSEQKLLEIPDSLILDLADFVKFAKIHKTILSRCFCRWKMQWCVSPEHYGEGDFRIWGSNPQIKIPTGSGLGVLRADLTLLGKSSRHRLTSARCFARSYFRLHTESQGPLPSSSDIFRIFRNGDRSVRFATWQTRRTKTALPIFKRANTVDAKALKINNDRKEFG